MYYSYEEADERRVSRAEKIQSAKSAFSHYPARGTGYRENGYRDTLQGRSSYGGGRPAERISSGGMGVDARREENSVWKEEKHHFGMFRMVIAGVLFFVMVLSFHFDFSYKGYNKEYVKEVLADDSHWESLVNQVTKVMKQTVPEGFLNQ